MAGALSVFLWFAVLLVVCAFHMIVGGDITTLDKVILGVYAILCIYKLADLIKTNVDKESK